MTQHDAPPVICRVTRGEMDECLHRGDIAVVDARGGLLAWVGNPRKVTYMRSSAKPLQALAVIESGAADRFGFSPRELAVVCGSHSGEAFHVETVRGILSKVGLSEDHLACGVHQPLCRLQAARLLREDRPPTPLYNNCSGKHAGMLAICAHLGLPVDGYWRPAHPVQRMMRAVVAEVSGFPEGRIVVGADVCGVCVFGLPLENMALAYARLVTPGALPPARSAAAARVVEAMVNHPEMVGGTGRLCTELIKAGGGRIIGKEGADGVYCAAVREAGIGLAVKVEDGNPRALGPSVVAALDQLGILPRSVLARLDSLRRPAVVNHRGETVGFVEPCFSLERRL